MKGNTYCLIAGVNPVTQCNAKCLLVSNGCELGNGDDPSTIGNTLWLVTSNKSM